MNIEKPFFHRIRSFVRRDSRMTDAQSLAFQERWPLVGLEVKEGTCDFVRIFKREAPVILEIGFGSGTSLLETAKTHPEINFIGVEMYRPGIGALLLGMQEQEIDNVRIYYADAVEVLEHCIALQSLDGVQIFFPDPWPKRRHHKRRLIQRPFIDLVVERLKSTGVLHVATDWEDYAKEMMKVLTQVATLKNMAGVGNFSDRSCQRPIVTKFEHRGHASGRKIWELQFCKA